MKERENRCFNIISVALIYILFIALLCGKLFANQIRELENDYAEAEDTNVVNWEELYPYDTEVETISVASNEKSVSKVEVYKYKVSKLGTFASVWAKNMYGYDDIAKAGYVICSRLSDPSVGNSYVKLKNGYWVQSCTSPVEEDAGDSAIVKYVALQNYVEGMGKDFIYFYPPQKECKYDPQLPDSVVSYTNQNMDTYMKAMDHYGLNYIDMRESLHSQGLDHYSMYYMSDHHWTVEAGLWAASEITEELNRRFGYSMISPKDLGTYTDVTYEKAEFGSAGAGVTHFVADSEDFTVPYPDFETSFRLEVPNRSVDVTGSFRDIFVDEEKIQELMSEGGGSAYGKILYGNMPYEKITNLNNENGSKILMIRDSFSIAVAPYLAESCSELVLLDVRPTNGNFTGSIINVINTIHRCIL